MIEYREYQPGDAEGYLRIHDQAFPPISLDYWQEWSKGPATAAVAVEDGRVVGAVPFHLRDFRLRADVTVPVAFEYSVCVDESLRDRGVGSGMMAAAKRFLRGRCLAMMVFRGGEQSLGYRYYARNGHHDLLYIRPWVLRIRPPVSAQAVLRCSWEDFLGWEAEAVEVFRSAYAAYGGHPQRRPGFYAPALTTPQFLEVPLDLSVLYLRQNGTSGPLLGYAILGQERNEPTLRLLEVATLGGNQAYALPLLASYANMAADRHLDACVDMPDSAPYAGLLAPLGFESTPRSQSSQMIMCHALDPEGLAAACWRESPATAGLEVLAWTPERQVTLHRAIATPRHKVILEMKEETLTRLVCARLDLVAAWREERVTAVGASPADIEAIAEALPFQAWTADYLEYI